jgi:cobalamin biosynthesis Mg chelatase CobN
MCRSVIYEKALVEIEDGKVYVTVRVQLVSNMGAIKFTVQQKAGDPASYASVSPRVTAEDAGTDTADYRFAVPAADSYIGCSTYVTPMGRDVKFYMNLSSNLTEGSADFVVRVKPKTAQTEPAAADGAGAETQSPVAETPNAAAGAGETAGAQGAAQADATGAASDETAADVAGGAGGAGDEIATPTDADNADPASAETAGEVETVGEAGANDADGEAGANLAETEVSGGNGETDDAIGADNDSAPDESAADGSTSSGPNSVLFIALGVIALIVIVGVIYIIRIKRK